MAIACGGNDDNGDNSVGNASLKKAAVNGVAEIAYASYSDALTGAQNLEVTLQALAAAPTAETLQAAKDAWINSRWPYGQTEAFRLTDDAASPIDGGEGPEGQINAWPLDETLIDNILANNVVNGNTVDVSSVKALAALNGLDGNEENVATGFHAIEYLLWGEDTSATGPGNLDITRFTAGSRRLTYLTTAANMLSTDIAQVKAEWAPGGTYRTSFTDDANIDTSLDSTLTGLAAMARSELAGERMTVLVAATPTVMTGGNAIEDEHSCFSDQTHRDIYLNYLGVHNILTGTYAGSIPATTSATATAVNALENGSNAVTANTTIMDLISNSTRKADLLASANESLAAVEVILTKGEDGSGDVFDQLAYKEDSANVNVESRGPIMDAAIKMTNLGENEIVAAGSDLGLTINPR